MSVEYHVYKIDPEPYRNWISAFDIEELAAWISDTCQYRSDGCVGIAEDDRGFVIHRFLRAFLGSRRSWRNRPRFFPLHS